MRKAIVEPCFGQIKERRGFRRFSLRGLKNVRAEWKLVCLTGNLLKLFRYGWTPQLAGGAKKKPFRLSVALCAEIQSTAGSDEEPIRSAICSVQTN